MRFFNNAPFMQMFGDIFEKPKQQAAPTIQQPHTINITKFVGQTLQQNDEPINAQYSIDGAPQFKGY